MPAPMFDPWIFGSELVFTVVAVAFCAAIYFRTRESYSLTKHEGIGYFRDAFLFFGLAYLMRFLLSVVFLSGMAFETPSGRDLLMPLFILPLGYFSTVAIFYLVFSTVWHHFDNRKMLVFGHTVAILLSLASFFARSPELLTYLQLALLAVALVSVFLIRKEEKRMTQTKLLYTLVFGLWLLNLWVTGRHHPFPEPVETLFLIVSLLVFVIIYFRVSKWAR